jgi:hypothetical protein
MKSTKNGVLAILAVALLVGALVFVNREPAAAQVQVQAFSPANPQYTVVETQGHNLLVTDNAKKTLYFYTVDKDQPIGSDLKLRASVDLTQVGKPEIKISKSK